MTAKKKIKEAEYFLNKIQSVSIKHINFLDFEVSAFLTSARSILYHLLEDYRIRFDLGEIKILNINNFKTLAKERGNKPALNFIEWFQKEKRLIHQNKRFGFLIDLRNINVHRKLPHRSLRITNKIHAKADVLYRVLHVIPQSGKTIKVNSIDQQSDKEDKTEWEITTMAYFRERPNEELVSLCKEFLEAIKSLVLEAESKWGARF